MRSEVIPAWVRVSLAGDIRLQSDFSELMRPYMLSHFEIAHRRDITDYERHFVEPPRGTKTEDEAFGKSFVDAFLDEYGISPARLQEISTVLAEYAYDQHTAIVVQPRRSLLNVLSIAGFSEREVSGLLRHFVLPNRSD